MKLSFIGFGNMAGAMAQGLIEFDCLPAQNIYASAAHFDKLPRSAFMPVRQIWRLRQPEMW